MDFHGILPPSYLLSQAGTGSDSSQPKKVENPDHPNPYITQEWFVRPEFYFFLNNLVYYDLNSKGKTPAWILLIINTSFL